MGIGDNIIATGLARGASARGKLIAFGNPGGRILWDKNSRLIFKNNPNIAKPGSEKTGNLEWIDFYAGKRHYNHVSGNRWVWNEFHPRPGEFFFKDGELQWAENLGSSFVVIEPNVNMNKSWSLNKIWPYKRYDDIARELIFLGHEVIQFVYGSGHILKNVRTIRTPSIRYAAAAMSRASLYVGAEGGMHHSAAAVNLPGVVLFGGFVDPCATGYDFHINITSGGKACGSILRCEHCRRAMQSITVEEVFSATLTVLNKRKAA